VPDSAHPEPSPLLALSELLRVRVTASRVLRVSAQPFAQRLHSRRQSGERKRQAARDRQGERAGVVSGHEPSVVVQDALAPAD
jgi:hypothetical protein